MQEFHALCEIPINGEEEPKTSEAGMHIILPYWPRLYSKLAHEQDRKVREETQKAHLIGEKFITHFISQILESYNF